MRLLLMLVIIVFGKTAIAQSTTPNIIIILADDLGYGDLGSYGGQQHTPNLDKLAQQGLRFSDFHSSGSVCSPTRAGLITGRYQQRSGVDGVVNADPNHPAYQFGVDPATEVTFPALVKQQGYRTALFGKWHIGYHQRFRPMNFGFDSFVGFLSGNIDYHSHYDRMENYDWWHGNKQVVEQGYSTHLITQHAVNFIEENKNTPFVMYVAHEAVHDPMQGPNDAIIRGPNKTKNAIKRSKKAIFSEMVGALDDSVGEIMAAVNKAGLANNTLIFFTSDNGPMKYSSPGPLRGRKGSLFEGGHRVPAIAWWPGTIKANTLTKQTAMSIDIMPTLLALTGAKAPAEHQFDGIDLSTLLKQGEDLPLRPLYWRNGGLTMKTQALVVNDSIKAMRQGKWKLLLTPYARHTMLFDLDNDVAEMTNLAQVHPQIAATMRQKLLAWEQEMLPYLPYTIKERPIIKTQKVAR